MNKNIHHYHLGKQYINGTLPIYYENDKLPKDYVKFSKDSVITLTKSNALIDLSHWYIGKEIYYQKSYNNNLQKEGIMSEIDVIKRKRKMRLVRQV